MNQTELMPAQLPKQEVATRQTGGTLDLQSLLTLAIQQNISPDAMEKMLALSERMAAIRAKADYDSAMASFQSTCPVIIKRKAGAQGAYRYAPLDAVVSQVRDLLRDNGFSYTITSNIAEGWVQALCKVTHTGGHSETSEFKCPIDTNNKMMTAPQRYGGAMTFAKRYSFCNAFGILTADEDTDGAAKNTVNTPPPAVTVKDLLLELWTVLKPVRGPENTWAGANQWLVDEAVIHDDQTAKTLTADELRAAIGKARVKLGKPV